MIQNDQGTSSCGWGHAKRAPIRGTTRPRAVRSTTPLPHARKRVHKVSKRGEDNWGVARYANLEFFFRMYVLDRLITPASLAARLLGAIGNRDASGKAASSHMRSHWQPQREHVATCSICCPCFDATSPGDAGHGRPRRGSISGICMPGAPLSWPARHAAVRASRAFLSEIASAWADFCPRGRRRADPGSLARISPLGLRSDSGERGSAA